MKHRIEKIPVNSGELEKMLPEMLKTPEGAAAACIFALHILARNAEDGKKALKLLDPDMAASRLQLAESQLEPSPWIMNSYFTGTDPADGYRLPSEVQFEFSTNKYSGSVEEGSVKLFTACSGAASPRPVTVKRRQNGTWYPNEWSSLIVGVAAPAE